MIYIIVEDEVIINIEELLILLYLELDQDGINIELN
jgi:hypothetical protein